MAVVHLGNTSVVVPFGEAQAVVHSADEAPPTPVNSQARPDLGQQITTITLGAGGSVVDVVSAYAAYSKDAPAWVESDDDVLAGQVAEHYGCPVGCPVSHDEWKEG